MKKAPYKYVILFGPGAGGNYISYCLNPGKVENLTSNNEYLDTSKAISHYDLFVPGTKYILVDCSNINFKYIMYLHILKYHFFRSFDFIPEGDLYKINYKDLVNPNLINIEIPSKVSKINYEKYFKLFDKLKINRYSIICIKYYMLKKNPNSVKEFIKFLKNKYTQNISILLNYYPDQYSRDLWIII